MAEYGPIEPLRNSHERSTFNCGSHSVSQWLRERASSAERYGTARTVVVTRIGENRVAGFYALVTADVEPADAPASTISGASRYLPIPAVLLAQLGVDLRDQRSGLGLRLFRDALLTTLRISQWAGVHLFLVDAESQAAEQFYRAHAPFVDNAVVQSAPRRLFLPIRWIRKAVSEPDPTGNGGAATE